MRRYELTIGRSHLDLLIFHISHYGWSLGGVHLESIHVHLEFFTDMNELDHWVKMKKKLKK